jgi:hypothetical protein
MSKKNRSPRSPRKTLKANIYENDYEELIYSTSPNTKVKHVDKPVKSKDKPKVTIKTKKETEADRNDIFGDSISTKPIHCKCNKCGGSVVATLVSMIYTAVSDLTTPFVSYHCEHCKHSGHRSVKEKALPSAEFEKYYF